MSEMFLFTQFPFKQAFTLHSLLNRLPMHDTGLAHVYPGVELPHQPVDDDLEVELPHPGNDRLGRFLLILDPERRVLLHELVQGDGELFLVYRGLGLDRQADDRFIKLYRFEEDGMCLIADRIPRRNLLEPHHRDDVACARLLHTLPLVCMHFQEPGDLLFLSPAGVVEFVASVDPSRIDPDIGQLPSLILHDLEGERRQRRPVAALSDLLLLRQGIDTRNGRDLFRRGKKIDNCVEDRLHPLVPQGRPAHDGHYLERNRRFPNGRNDLLRGNLHPIEIFLGNCVIDVGENGDHSVPLLHRQRQDLLRDIRTRIGQPSGSFIPGDDLPQDKVHDPPEVLLLSKGDLNRQRQ